VDLHGVLADAPEALLDQAPDLPGGRQDAVAQLQDHGGGSVRAPPDVTLSGARETNRYPRSEEETDMAVAMFAAGCFWQVEAEFRQTEGVLATEVGYSGGVTEDPTYREVCTDRTGHAEVVRVEFDPSKISYDALLDVFWSLHDPTTVNRQGPDVGSQYRSAIFVSDAEQENAAEASKARAQERSRRPIVTEITTATEFYPAEEYHQRYLEKRGLATCRIPS
jgi:peptide-methionine (S)-S-oxide reductase